MTRFTLALTGASGFIGGHVAGAAEARGWRVTRISRSAVDGGIDLEDPRCDGALEDALRGADAVVHAAARVQHFGRRQPIIRANVGMTERVVRAAEAVGAPRFVFLSSASVLFEAHDQLGLREDAPMPRRWLSGYAESKARSEEALAAYAGSSAVLRPQAVIGPGDRGLLPPIIDAARSGRWRWLGGQRDAETDLMSVKNLAEYVCAAASSAEATGVFHMSDGLVLGIRSVLAEVFDALGVDAGERRLSQGTALRLAGALETAWRLVAPRVEPPLTRFAVEVLTRSRTVDRTRTLGHFGPPLESFEEGLRLAIQSARILEAAR